MQSYWQRQTASKPLYPGMLWSRPENKLYAGKLLIIGGNLHGFASPAAAYAAAQQAGAGTIRVLLPDALAKTLGKNFMAGEFAPSNPSGSFGSRSLAEMLGMAQWADAVLIDGDLGKNSETAIVIEKFTNKYKGPLIAASDAIEILTTTAEPVMMRQQTLLVVTLNQLQRLLAAVHFPHAATSDMGRMRLAELLHLLTLRHHAGIIVGYDNQLFVASEGRVSSTAKDLQDGWQTVVASQAAVWWMQNPSSQFEAATTACL